MGDWDGKDMSLVTKFWPGTALAVSIRVVPVESVADNILAVDVFAVDDCGSRCEYVYRLVSMMSTQVSSYTKLGV